MKIPYIRYYAGMIFDTNSKKIPKYIITKEAGYYEPMEQIKGRNGLVSMYLMEKLKDGANVPSMRLQAKNSLNFTGLKDYFVDGRLSGFAYGYPLADKVYSSKKIENPFYEYRNDGFLFIIHQDQKAATVPEQIRPTFIELIVLDGAKVLIPSYCKQLMMGGFDEAINQLRKQAKAL
ncbi:hypothetical protein H6A58_12165 [Phocaeicola coprocola]|uniref:hypothetical protein n=1 Tax=Phocaeicola coprocola TaxID=310298 RepID=UPI0019581AC1|nr:hypothetical protein [Phocaeicola coprocola]MBM6903856.1 hypothetical protein [Phocaeicola coprocola]